MGWFDEQIKDRIRADNEAFEDSFIRAAGIIMGSRLSTAMNDQRQAATDAIGELLKAYHIKPKEVPDSITDMNETLEYLMRPQGRHELAAVVAVDERKMVVEPDLDAAIRDFVGHQSKSLPVSMPCLFLPLRRHSGRSYT